MLSLLLLGPALAQDVSTWDDPFGESTVEEIAPVNPETIAAEAAERAAEQQRIASFYDETPQATSGASTGFGDSWMFVVGALGLGGLVLARKKLLGKVAEAAGKKSALTVISRQGLGHQGGLVLVEAQTGDGGSRRLLIGVSSGATPQLVADLGGDFAMVVEDEPIATPVLAQPEPEPAPVLATPSRAPEPEPVIETAKPKRALVGRFTDADLAPLPETEWRTASGLDDHLSLVDEVLAGRLRH